MRAAEQQDFGHGAVGETAVAIATTKVGYGFGQAVALGMLCNALVCLAVWLCYGARSTADKILAIVPPIAAFVALGFEHSVANMYFVPFAIFAGADISWGHFVTANLIPVTIGNIVGGSLMVGAVYWFVYLRPRP